MAIDFLCTQCGTPLRAGDGSAGQRVLCASCGQFSIVPEKKAGPQDAWTAPAEPAFTGPVRLAGEGENPFTAPQETQWTTYRSPGETDNRGAIALVLGVVSLGTLLFCPCVGLPFAIGGLAVGIPAIKTENRGLAIAGVICSGLAILGCLATLGIFLLCFLAAATAG